MLVVDDHPEMLARTEAALRQTCSVVGTALDGPSALRAIATLKPDVVVLDVAMPKMSGLDVGARLRQEGSTVRVVFYSAYDSGSPPRASARAPSSRNHASTN